jgi:mevalonate pyrophosphate decarboxylase
MSLPAIGVSSARRRKKIYHSRMEDTEKKVLPCSLILSAKDAKVALRDAEEDSERLPAASFSATHR